MSNSASLFPLNSFQIEDSIGYLVARTRTMLVKNSDKLLNEYGITYAQGAILLMLSTGKYATAADLARETYIDAASMKRMFDRLGRRELIRRAPCLHDRRLVKVCLTDDGAELAEQVSAVLCGVLSQQFADFTAEEIGFLKSLLRRVLANNGLVPAFT